jgi:hypothetical protein
MNQPEEEIHNSNDVEEIVFEKIVNIIKYRYQIETEDKIL